MSTGSAPLPPSVVELAGPFEHTFLHVRGLRLHAATAGDPSDPLVVLLHGSFGGWFDYRHAIGPLAERGFHVAALDMRGFGMSDKPPVEAGQDIRTLTGDVSGVITALGHSAAFVVGADTGASVAWSLATEHPERVRGLVSVSGAHPVDLRRAIAARPWDFMWILLRSGLARLPRPVVRALPSLKQWAFHTYVNRNCAPATAKDVVDDELLLRLRAAAIGKTQRGFLWNNRQLLAATPLRWADALIDAPVLFLTSSQRLWRPVIQRAHARTAGAFAASSIPGAKNLPMVENPAAFTEMLASWFTSP
ncbi:alpha/beta fold hydrolase [Corynebacterium massiliense]|uniref:Soluble epoxide hydrolase n=1 Tax=Corynebacterium massiliense DSM 45435 TaxID=1121364 RepID=A0ABY7U4R7_9CORY|nr:alpha/beta hydrolase [Corynebacterium massiliense]WCZ31660.1 Soluble epoxide hydrolase [Corynebacterium massiliense DSM 45435]